MRRVLLLLSVVLMAEGQARVPVLHLRDYIGALEAIRAADAAAARTRAQQLLGAEVDSPAGRFTADGALLREILANPAAARPHLDATLDALRAALPRGGAAAADPRLLERLRAEETADAMKAGGEIRTLPADDQTLRETAGVFGKAWRWIKRQLDKLANWFSRWWPDERSTPDARKPVIAPRWIVTLVTIAIVLVLGILAFEVVRRSRRAPADETVTSDPVTSRRDEDPLSRGANEWERYAAQLAAAGRTREAIRAWYHAVLVTLYAAGILHFKKGRTNWEYIASLAPDVPWRAQFVALTRYFENEWYGHERSSVEALDETAGRARGILDAVRRRAAA
jgi:hypothetical protein